MTLHAHVIKQTIYQFLILDIDASQYTDSDSNDSIDSQD